MNNKLSELKAIAEKAKELGGINNYKKGKDAVAAFIAAANPATVLALLAELEAKTKHIADMEQVVAAAKCDDELWDAMAHRLKTLEAKLATPVRLPPLMDGELFGKNSGTANAHNNAITACSIAIRGAGFKSEVTAPKCVGDE